jgi:glyoxylase-like metal-dependent hydrolase (beta-lactamase superfamily II)
MALIHTIDHPVVDGIRVGRMRRDGSFHLISTCIVYRVGEVAIDTGPSNEWPVIRDYFKDKGLSSVLLTHHHEDHSGNGAHFELEFNAKIFSHENNHHALSGGIELPYTRRKTFGNVQAFHPETLPDSIATNNGYTLKPIHVPGHSNDLCCYLEPNEGWLFSGDLYVSSRLKYMTIEEDMGLWIDSLKRVLALPFDTIFCAHRAVIESREGLERKLAFFEEFMQQSADMYKRGMSARAITRKLLGREDIATFLSHGYMSKKKMVDSALRSQGLIEGAA